jgi:hypothetical protein
LTCRAIILENFSPVRWIQKPYSADPEFEWINEGDYTLEAVDLFYSVNPSRKNKLNGMFSFGSIPPGGSRNIVIPVPPEWGVYNNYHVQLVVRESFKGFRKGDVLMERMWGVTN